jgi:hypothetical protein
MIPLFKRVVYAFFYDELAAVRWIRGALMGSAGLVALVPDGQFGIPGWVYKIAAAAMLGIGGSITAGQKNPVPVDTLSPKD